MDGLIIFGGIALMVWFLTYFQKEKHPIRVRTRQELEATLANFLRKGADRAHCYVYRRPKGLRVRVRKYVRKTRPDALVLEVGYAANKEQYPALRAAMDAHGTPYDEYFTKKRKDPKLIRMKFDDPDAGIAGQASAVFQLLSQVVYGDAPFYFWVGSLRYP